MTDRDQIYNHQDDETCDNYPNILEAYLRKEMSKANRPQTDNKVNKLIDQFALLKQHEHITNMERRWKTYQKRQCTTVI